MCFVKLHKQRVIDVYKHITNWTRAGYDERPLATSVPIQTNHSHVKLFSQLREERWLKKKSEEEQNEPLSSDGIDQSVSLVHFEVIKFN